MTAPALTLPPRPEHRFHIPLLVFSGFGGIVAGFVLMAVHQFRISSSPLAACGLALLVMSLAAVIVLAVTFHRRMVRTQAEAAARLGLTVVRKVSKEQRHEFLQGLRGLHAFRFVARINWYATGVVDERPVAVCHILTSAGEEGSSILVAVTPCPATWPSFEIARGGRGTRTAHRLASKLLGARVTPVIDGLDSGLLVTGVDGDGVKALLDDEAQRSVAQSKVFEHWEINAGRLVLEFDAVTGGEAWMEWGVQRLLSFADHLDAHAAINETAPVEPGLRR